MKNINTKFITRTAVLLALTIVFQVAGRSIPLGPNSNFIVGPLVNACLIISTAIAGLWSGTIISIVAPYFAALTSHSPLSPFILAFSPFIAAGNFILVLMIHLLRKRNYFVGLISGSVLKFIVLYGGLHIMLGIKTLPGPQAQMVSFLFSWPQLVTALAGGVIAYSVLKVLLKSIKSDEIHL